MVSNLDFTPPMAIILHFFKSIVRLPLLRSVSTAAYRGICSVIQFSYFLRSKVARIDTVLKKMRIQIQILRQTFYTCLVLLSIFFWPLFLAGRKLRIVRPKNKFLYIIPLYWQRSFSMKLLSFTQSLTRSLFILTWNCTI